MDELNHGINKKCSTNPIFKIENYFQMDPVNIWALNLGLKINIWPFLIHFMQPNVSLIKKIMMHIDFLGKNLYPVGWAKLSSKSVVICWASLKAKRWWHLVGPPAKVVLTLCVVSHWRGVQSFGWRAAWRAAVGGLRCWARQDVWTKLTKKWV